MAEAGQLLEAGRIPGELIARVEITVDSATFTAETVVGTIVAPLVEGRTYRVVCDSGWQATVSGGDVIPHLREDNLVGIERQSDRVRIHAVVAAGYRSYMSFWHTAVATANKTFVLTGETASGNGRLEAAANRPTNLAVYYEEG